MEAVSQNHSVSSWASTMPAGQSKGPNSPESAAQTMGPRASPAAETRTTLLAHMMSIDRATDFLPPASMARTILPCPVSRISSESGYRDPTWPSSPVPRSIMSNDGRVPDWSTEGCEAIKAAYDAATSVGEPEPTPCTLASGTPHFVVNASSAPVAAVRGRSAEDRRGTVCRQRDRKGTVQRPSIGTAGASSQPPCWQPCGADLGSTCCRRCARCKRRRGPLRSRGRRSSVWRAP
mmetsp:Transcript_31093/g.109422  ORF Transcript_31093/g.109422 Transcript_31093/m.109422 type:complete len:235 (+) Transcript_31093:295-999(+)